MLCKIDNDHLGGKYGPERPFNPHRYMQQHILADGLTQKDGAWRVPLSQPRQQHRPMQSICRQAQ